jgi:hypothetical protein
MAVQDWPIAMNEENYISEIESNLPTSEKTPLDVISLVSKAVRDFPGSAHLWFLHGEAIASAEDPFGCAQRIAKESFKKCVELDSGFTAAHERLKKLGDPPQA